jgi:hypothetical protein
MDLEYSHRRKDRTAAAPLNRDEAQALFERTFHAACTRGVAEGVWPGDAAASLLAAIDLSWS